MSQSDLDAIITMDISLRVTVAQAVAFSAFLDYWERIERAGLRQEVGITYVSHSEEHALEVQISYSDTEPIPILTQELFDHSRDYFSPKAAHRAFSPVGVYLYSQLEPKETRTP